MTLSRRSVLSTAVRAGRAGLVAALALPLAGFASFEALFAPRADLWPRWQAHDPASTERIDHRAWADLLTAYLRAGDDGINRFDYAAVTTADRAALAQYLADLSALPIDAYNRSEQLAYWINLYNALTVQVVLSHYPVDSIRDIDVSPGLFSDGPWDLPLIRVAGEDLTLNDIEHRILRPIWRDPRIHYAVNCASLGCPNLQPLPFTGATVEDMFEGAAREYVNSPRAVEINQYGIFLSSLYIWFQEDFGNDDSALIEHLARYAEPELASGLRRAGKIAGHDYDWALNGYMDAGT